MLSNSIIKKFLVLIFLVTSSSILAMLSTVLAKRMTPVAHTPESTYVARTIPSWGNPDQRDAYKDGIKCLIEVGNFHPHAIQDQLGQDNRVRSLLEVAWLCNDVEHAQYLMSKGALPDARLRQLMQIAHPVTSLLLQSPGIAPQE